MKKNTDMLMPLSDNMLSLMSEMYELVEDEDEESLLAIIDGVLVTWAINHGYDRNKIGWMHGKFYLGSMNNLQTWRD